MRHFLVAANWKMFGDRSLIEQWAEKIELHENIDICWFPPAIWIPVVQEKLVRSGKHERIGLGIQDISPELQTGPYTGEISAQMAKDCGCHYVLVGHSERRCRHQENDMLIARKFYAALDVGLIPILCIGETLEQYENKQAEQIIYKQLKNILKKELVKSSHYFYVAYEPVWAIGRGEMASSSYISAISGMIKDCCDGFNYQMIYGGSVGSHNVSELFSEIPVIQGLLVGKASLNPEHFLSICQICACSGI